MVTPPGKKMASDAIATSNWISRPSIRWEALPSSSGGCYWNQDVIDAMRASTSSDDGCPPNQLSYKCLIFTASLVVQELRQELRKVVGSTNMDELQEDQDVLGIPIAVAIPEGPLLPLATLVIHALNDPARIHPNSPASASFSAILVPVEPSEAKRRNLDILRDVLPSKILAVPGKDMNRLKSIVTDLPEIFEPRISSGGLYTQATPELVDFQDLVLTVLRKSRSTKLADRFDSLWSDSRLNTVHIQTLVSTCSDFLWRCSNGEIFTAVSFLDQNGINALEPASPPRISHIVFTSGTTGRPKGCISSIRSLQQYITAKNEAHSIDEASTVLLASALSFDPCLSDILATFHAKAVLAIAPRADLLGQLSAVVRDLKVTHVLCTPTLWSLVNAGSAHPYRDFPHLQAIALGGEPIPQPIRRAWARTKKNEPANEDRCRLFATYGVTEACVYQTCGEVIVSDDTGRGQLVGRPLRGMSVRICEESNQDSLLDVAPGHPGEVVLLGEQCDEFTGYLKRPELRHKFQSEQSEAGGPLKYHYRTGDRGTLDTADGTLRIIGRIIGEEGMVKINGVRVELGEIESALIDDVEDATGYSSLVMNCCSKYISGASHGSRSEIQAFCVLSHASLAELGINWDEDAGILITGGPLLELLRARCARRVKAACMPTTFVIIPRVPLSPTGKRDRDGLPSLEECVPLNREDQASSQTLKEYGSAGAFVAENVIDCLNLQPAQEIMVTTSVSFSMLGGDSLAATRITRALYAHHHQVENSRFLGGAFGKLDGHFDVVHLLGAKTLGDYVDMLDNNNIGGRRRGGDSNNDVVSTEMMQLEEEEEEAKSGETDCQSRLYDALLQATTIGHFSVALALLDVGTDPNFGAHGGRLGKVTDRHQQKALFRSSPLHLACLKGHPKLIKKLLKRGAKSNSPDASGMYPLHLAASGMDGESSRESEDLRRLACVEALLAAGVPRTMRGGNKQSVLHAAARAGHSRLLRQVMMEWKEECGDENDANRFFQSRDRWFRTPVHWAVLNGRVDALRILLEMGCSPCPPRPKANRRSSAAVESPMELCDRVYGIETMGTGAEIRNLLLASSR
jgi:acyl-CoA synthetase (AMP-forming)/AMP-acid ligase II/ankyrin repeat protein